MPIIEVPGYGQVEFPDNMSDDQIAAAIKRNMFNDKLQQPVPQNFARQTAPQTKPATAMQKIMRGMVDPFEGGGQFLYNLLPEGVQQAGNKANNAMADYGLTGRIPQGGFNEFVKQGEQAYQASRAAGGESGFDGYRMLGNVASPANLAVAAKASQAPSMLARAASSGAVGATQGAMAPVYEGDYATEKAKQVALGGVAGGVMAPVTGAFARVTKPTPNADVQMLIDNGVTPTVGQRFGGALNRAEQKIMSVPYVGDIVGNARNKTREEFNRGALNRTLKPIGGKSQGIGTQGFANADDQIGAVYNQAKSMMGGFQIDPQAGTELANLQSLAKNLTPELAKKFDREFQSKFVSRLSGNNSLLADTYKTIDSDLGTLTRRYQGSSVASEQELGDALAELQRIINANARRANPDADALMRQADEAYANLVRVERATKSAANSDGVFTPGQLMQGVRQSDKSVRGRAVSKGEALMQDYASAGQNVIGNTVPNSGTADRAMLALLAGGGVGAFNTPALVAGTAAALPYMPVGRQLVHAMTTQRPKFAGQAANVIRKSAPFAVPAVSPLLYGLLGGSE